MSAGENPYQAPRTTDPGGIPDAPEPFGWEIRDRIVWVEKRSQFPMVDPFTGRTGDIMMLQKVDVRYRPRWLMTLMPLGALVSVLLFARSGVHLEWIGNGIVGLFFGWLAYGISSLFFPQCSLQLFFENRTLRIRKNLDRLMSGLFLLFLPGAFLFALGPGWMHVIPWVAGLGWVIGTAAMWLFQRKIRCFRKDGERFGVTGFHPEALASFSTESP